jgi:hypothetical protein
MRGCCSWCVEVQLLPCVVAGVMAAQQRRCSAAHLSFGAATHHHRLLCHPLCIAAPQVLPIYASASHMRVLPLNPMCLGVCCMCLQGGDVPVARRPAAAE